MQISRTRLAVLVVGLLFLMSSAGRAQFQFQFDVVGDAAGDQSGFAVSGAGDVNGDGFDDFVVGSPMNDNNGADAGCAKVYSGHDQSLIYTFNGDAPGAHLGFSVAGAGDVNNDGFADVIVGAPSTSDTGLLSGIARVYSGLDGSVLRTINGQTVGDKCGYRVAGLGDVDQDGHDDYLIGSPQNGGIATGSGVVRLHSGADNATLATFWGNTNRRYGEYLAAAGDVDGDGIQDVFIGAGWNFGTSGSAQVYSGADARLIHNFASPAFDESFGVAVSSAGDVNGDGFDDLIVGSPLDDISGNSSGEVHVFSGADGGLLHHYPGIAPNEQFGASVSGAGDVNGDGFDDFVVGAPQGSNGTSPAGNARVYSGKDGSVFATLAGTSSGDQFAISLQAAGDVNRDGFADIVVGTRGRDANGPESGAASVFFGFRPPNSMRLTGDAAGDRFGWSADGAGDVNGDGFDDVIIGAPFDDNTGIQTGSARIISGIDGSTIWTMNGNSPDDFFGISVSAAGDVNNDGFADVVIGAVGDDTAAFNAGAARVYSGVDGSTLYQFFGDSPEEHFGSSVSGAGDVNGDGHADIIVGAPHDAGNGANSGNAKVYSGKDGSMLLQFNGDSAGNRFGNSVSGAGDFNGDGFDDVIVGAVRDDKNGPWSGSARVFSGLDGKVLFKILGDSAGDQLGISVSDAGDVDGDGRIDLIVGAFGDSTSAPGAGSARVIAGGSGAILGVRNGDSPFDGFGSSVSGAGDVNGDGRADMIVGAAGNDHNGLDAGSIRIYSGLDGSVLGDFYGDRSGDAFGFCVAAAGDVDGDGFDDIVIGATGHDANGNNAGGATIHSLPPADAPVRRYNSTLAPSELAQTWTPDGNNPYAKTGTLTCSGATPWGCGLYGVSLAPANIVSHNVALLIANDPANLLESGSFTFDGLGQKTTPNISRQNAFLAGFRIFVQYFEKSPVQASSNGLEIVFVP